MTQHDPTDVAEMLRDELPAEWSFETDGDRVYGYADGYDTDADGPAGVPASVSAEPVEGGVWGVDWQEPNGRRGGAHDRVDVVSGAAERVVSWAAERALDLHHEFHAHKAMSDYE